MEEIKNLLARRSFSGGGRKADKIEIQAGK